ncbi:MAG: CDP-diacylglycerol--serine O-phosphatidyltransferase [Porphyromonadaceae bacterium]|nr:MAG: CDP-diacylglycerol--serine O-phosphatidyltransferase [Porphyromonadaceae bacterium]
MKRIIRNIVQQIPNTLTLLNLLCGSLAVLLALRGYLLEGAILVSLGFIFDLFDGMAARLLKAHSPIGKELDSLADLITFGLAPAALLFGIQEQLGEGRPFSLTQPAGTLILRLLPFLLPVFAGLRLAKFNIDERQSHQFIGLPSPANGLMVLALPLVMHSQPNSFLIDWLNNDLFVPLYSVIVSYLMVSPLRLYSMKIKGFSLKQNKYTYLFAAIALSLIIIFGYTGLFLTIPVYILYSGILAIAVKE